MIHKWFVIINPTSGNAKATKKWPVIKKELFKQHLKFEHFFTEYEKHEVVVVQNAIKKGYKKFICVGGDGTLHHIVNGILSLDPLNISNLKIGVIPIGTGNDWVRSYGIPTTVKKAVQIIKNEYTVAQDIGKINLSNKVVYFNNIAGIGFDGYIIYKVEQYKKLGVLAYLTAAVIGLLFYKKCDLKIQFNNKTIHKRSLMLLIGICKFSGGGMQLTKDPDPSDGLFDISYIETFTLFVILKNIVKLFNGKITSHKLINTFKTSSLKVGTVSNEKTFIQADGELVGSGDFSVSILQKSLHFIISPHKS